MSVSTHALRTGPCKRSGFQRSRSTLGSSRACRPLWASRRRTISCIAACAQSQPSDWDLLVSWLRWCCSSRCAAISRGPTGSRWSWSASSAQWPQTCCTSDSASPTAPARTRICGPSLPPSPPATTRRSATTAAAARPVPPVPRPASPRPSPAARPVTTAPGATAARPALTSARLSCPFPRQPSPARPRRRSRAAGRDLCLLVRHRQRRARRGQAVGTEPVQMAPRPPGCEGRGGGVDARRRSAASWRSGWRGGWGGRVRPAGVQLPAGAPVLPAHSPGDLRQPENSSLVAECRRPRSR